MALFKQGNRFWEARTTVKKYFEEPDALYASAEEYFNYCFDNPVEITEKVKVTGGINPTDTDKTREIPILFSWKGFCVFLGVTDSYFRKFRFDLKSMADKEKAERFVTVIEQIDMVMYTQKLQGAAGGVYKENIIARELGLADKTINENHNTIVNSVPMSKDEIKDIYSQLKDSL